MQSPVDQLPQSTRTNLKEDTNAGAEKNEKVDVNGSLLLKLGSSSTPLHNTSRDLQHTGSPSSIAGTSENGVASSRHKMKIERIERYAEYAQAANQNISLSSDIDERGKVICLYKSS